LECFVYVCQLDSLNKYKYNHINMKNIYLKVCLTGSLLLLTTFVFCQNIVFTYDASGNRISRIEAKKEIKTTLADSILPDTAYKQVNLDLSKLNISIYPNPSTDVIHIQCSGFNDDSNVEGYLYSLKAELLTSFKLKSSEQIVSLDKYTRGVYFLKIRVNNEVESWRIIKQ